MAALCLRLLAIGETRLADGIDLRTGGGKHGHERLYCEIGYLYTPVSRDLRTKSNAGC